MSPPSSLNDKIVRQDRTRDYYDSDDNVVEPRRFYSAGLMHELQRSRYPGRRVTTSGRTPKPAGLQRSSLNFYRDETISRDQAGQATKSSDVQISKTSKIA